MDIHALLHISYMHNLAQSSAISSTLLHANNHKDIFKSFLAYCHEEAMP